MATQPLSDEQIAQLLASDDADGPMLIAAWSQLRREVIDGAWASGDARTEAAVVMQARLEDRIRRDYGEGFQAPINAEDYYVLTMIDPKVWSPDRSRKAAVQPLLMSSDFAAASEAQIEDAFTHARGLAKVWSPSSRQQSRTVVAHLEWMLSKRTGLTYDAWKQWRTEPRHLRESQMTGHARNLATLANQVAPWVPGGQAYEGDQTSLSEQHLRGVVETLVGSPPAQTADRLSSAERGFGDRLSQADQLVGAWLSSPHGAQDVDSLRSLIRDAATGAGLAGLDELAARRELRAATGAPLRAVWVTDRYDAPGPIGALVGDAESSQSFHQDAQAQRELLHYAGEDLTHESIDRDQHDRMITQASVGVEGRWGIPGSSAIHVDRFVDSLTGSAVHNNSPEQLGIAWRALNANIAEAADLGPAFMDAVAARSWFATAVLDLRGINAYARWGVAHLTDDPAVAGPIRAESWEAAVQDVQQMVGSGAVTGSCFALPDAQGVTSWLAKSDPAGLQQGTRADAIEFLMREDLRSGDWLRPPTTSEQPGPYVVPREKLEVEAAQEDFDNAQARAYQALNVLGAENVTVTPMTRAREAYEAATPVPGGTEAIDPSAAVSVAEDQPAPYYRSRGPLAQLITDPARRAQFDEAVQAAMVVPAEQGSRPAEGLGEDHDTWDSARQTELAEVREKILSTYGVPYPVATRLTTIGFPATGVPVVGMLSSDEVWQRPEGQLRSAWDELNGAVNAFDTRIAPEVLQEPKMVSALTDVVAARSWLAATLRQQRGIDPYETWGVDMTSSPGRDFAAGLAWRAMIDDVSVRVRSHGPADRDLPMAWPEDTAEEVREWVAKHNEFAVDDAARLGAVEWITRAGNIRPGVSAQAVASMKESTMQRLRAAVHEGGNLLERTLADEDEAPVISDVQAAAERVAARDLSNGVLDPQFSGLPDGVEVNANDVVFSSRPGGRDEVAVRGPDGFVNVVAQGGQHWVEIVDKAHPEFGVPEPTTARVDVGTAAAVVGVDQEQFSAVAARVGQALVTARADLEGDMHFARQASVEEEIMAGADVGPGTVSQEDYEKLVEQDQAQAAEVRAAIDRGDITEATVEMMDPSSYLGEFAVSVRHDSARAVFDVARVQSAAGVDLDVFEPDFSGAPGSVNVELAPSTPSATAPRLGDAVTVHLATDNTVTASIQPVTGRPIHDVDLHTAASVLGIDDATARSTVLQAAHQLRRGRADFQHPDPSAPDATIDVDSDGPEALQWAGASTEPHPTDDPGANPSSGPDPIAAENANEVFDDWKIRAASHHRLSVGHRSFAEGQSSVELVCREDPVRKITVQLAGEHGFTVKAMPTPDSQEATVLPSGAEVDVWLKLSPGEGDRTVRQAVTELRNGEVGMRAGTPEGSAHPERLMSTVPDQSHWRRYDISDLYNSASERPHPSASRTIGEGARQDMSLSSRAWQLPPGMDSPGASGPAVGM